MPETNDGWFREIDSKDTISVSLKVSKTLYEGKSKFQDIKIIRNHEFGNVLILDGGFQTTEFDEFLYHEMLVHVPMATHPNPQEVLIVGAGDGGALRETLKHPVKKVVMVELDGDVIDVSKKFLPSLSNGAFDDKRAEIIVGDGADYMGKYKNRFDVIILDLTDPIMDEAKALYNPAFFKNLFNALKPDGVFSMQAGSKFFRADLIKNYSFVPVSQFFPITKVYLCDIPAYGTTWPLIIGSKKHDPEKPRQLALKGFKCYNIDYHKAAFKLPNFLAQALYGQAAKY
jgi:spermidine synthase